MTNYGDFLESKAKPAAGCGFEPLSMPDFLFDFQAMLTDWMIRNGRSAVFADCGLGKTPMSLVWGDNVLRKTNRPVMIFTPLAVAHQYVREGEKFGIEVHHARDGKVYKGINVVNYERLHYFDRKDFSGVVCDESGRVKHHDTKTRKAVADFTRNTPYRLLGTATPAPNDFMELGNSAEILGVMKYAQVLSMFFTHDGKNTQQWRLRGHAKRRFWQWVSGWARAVRKPSDLGFDDGRFELPTFQLSQHTVKSQRPTHGFLVKEARTLDEQRLERKLTLCSRCEKVAEIVPKNRPFLVWCHLNPEGDLLEKLIPGAVQVAGRHSDDEKEERLNAFSQGQIRVLITKPKIGGWGLNWQHCSDMSFFPSHSWEQWYQAVRRCWRFGQERPVNVNIVTSEAEASVLSNMQRKEKQAEEMYNGIIRGMAEFQMGHRPSIEKNTMEVPSWL